MKRALNVMVLAAALLSFAPDSGAEIVIQETMMSPYAGATMTGDNITGGSYCNSITAGAVGATIAGGGGYFVDSGFPSCMGNSVTNDFGTVGGGRQNTAAGYATAAGGIGNTASGNASTVSGGWMSTASGSDSTVSGGTGNLASGVSSGASTVSGGDSNTASGDYSTVPGGKSNTASGNYSFAAGCTAKAQGFGSFVWADGNCDMAGLPVIAANAFYVRSSGGVYFRTNPTGPGTSGSYLAAGGSSWLNLSDRDSKENFAPVNSLEILEKIDKMPIQTWNLKSQDKAIRHIGPMAQDFHQQFEFGEDMKYVNSGDMDGISLAAIKGLYQMNKEQKDEIAVLTQKLADRDADIQTLKKTMLEITSRLAAVESSGRTVASK